MRRMWEITSLDTGRTVRMTTREAHAEFGRDEFAEIAAGHLPHLVAVRVDEPDDEAPESDAIEITEAAIDGEPWAVELYERSERKFATTADVSAALWAATRE